MRYLDDDDDGDRELRDGESVRVPVFLTDAVRFEDGEPHFVRAGSNQTFDGHRPGFARLTDEQIAKRREARQEMIDRAANAWRSPRDANPPQFTCPECHGTGKDPDGDSPDDDKCDMCGGTGSIRGPNRLSSFQRHDPGPYPDADLRLDRRRVSVDAQVTDARRAAYDGYVRRLSQAWKHRPARDASQPDNSSSMMEWRRHLRGEPDDDHDAPAMLRRHLQTEGNEENQRRRDDAWARYRDGLGNAWRRGRTNPTAATRIEKERERYLGKFE